MMTSRWDYGVSSPGDFSLVIESITAGTRPAAAMGTAVTPVQNATNGTYAQLISGANLTQDAYAIEINVNNIGTNGVARDALTTIGLDQAGGTSYTGIVDLLCGNAATYSGGNPGGGGMSWWFPLFIKSGTSIGARGSVNSATLTAYNVFCRVYCRPTRKVRAGRYIEQFGVTTATSTGTDITASVGAASEGTYVALGSTIARECWFFEFGFGNNDSADSSNTYDVDIAIGDGSTKRQIMFNRPVFTNTNENVAKPAAPTWARGHVGQTVYGRAQVGPSSTDTVSLAVYGVGG